MDEVYEKVASLSTDAAELLDEFENARLELGERHEDNDDVEEAYKALVESSRLLIDATESIRSFLDELEYGDWDE